MSEPVSLLPQHRTQWEESLSLTSAARRPLPAHIIKDATDPWRCPEHLLPWLAWSWSVDLWSDAWPVERKRQVIARSIRLHRIKGTEAGLREHLALVDADLRQVVTPPQRLFASPTLTKEEMDAWLRTMPQIRVYLAREFGSAQGLSFAGHFAGHSIARFDAGRGIFGRAARLWDRGQETRIRLVEITTEREQRKALRVEQVFIPGNAGFGAFVGRFVSHCFAGAVGRRAQTYTYRQNLTYEHTVSALSMQTVVPGFDPVDVRSERVSKTGHDEWSGFAKRRFARHCFARSDQGDWLLHDRIVLHDPSRAAPKVRAWSFANHTRIGHPKFTAKAVIDGNIKAPIRGVVAGSSFSLQHFAMPEDTSRREAQHLAIRVSKAARDRILYTNKLTRPLTFGDRIKMDGSMTFGTRVQFRL